MIGLAVLIEMPTVNDINQIGNAMTFQACFLLHSLELDFVPESFVKIGVKNLDGIGFPIGFGPKNCGRLSLSKEFLDIPLLNVSSLK